MSSTVRIADLPREMTPMEAVEEVYREDLEWIEAKLRRGLSVLVECDKMLNVYLYPAIRNRLKREVDGPPVRCKLIDGRGRDAEKDASARGGIIQAVLKELQAAIAGADPDTVLALYHLDILATTTQSGLSMETREAIAWIYENPEVTFLGFRDPSFEIPKVIEDVFAARRALVGIPRQKLPRVILQREARKFGTETFNPFALYKYVSGLNAVKLREILGHFADYTDHHPDNPQAVERIYREIREMTLLGSLEVPRVDLERDIGGYRQVKRRIEREILSLLRAKDASTDAELIGKIESTIPRGMIFTGPPGTGKTFFSKAIATAIDATVLVVSGPELKSKWVGESEANLRRIFAQARKSAPSVIIFDELDSFATTRGTYTGSGVEHSMVNQLLTEMDGFRSEELVFVIGTTNFAQGLDPALLRPGRFEFQIEIPYPHDEDRREIIEVYRERFGLDMPEAAVEHLVHKTSGFLNPVRGIRFSGDHLYAVCRALMREQIRRGGPFAVTRQDVDRAVAGLQPERRKPVRIREDQKLAAASHEAGHAVAAGLLPHARRMVKVTIVGEGMTPFYAQARQDETQELMGFRRSELLDEICVLLAGRAAEEQVIGDVGAGVQMDLAMAAEYVRAMVEDYGMSERIGPRAFTYPDFRSGSLRRVEVSDGMREQIDEEIGRILREAGDRVKQLLEEQRETLERMTAALLAKSTLYEDEIGAILRGESPNPKARDPDSRNRTPEPRAGPTLDAERRTLDLTDGS